MTLVSTRLALAALLLSATPLLAQTQSPAAKAPGGFTYSAVNLVYRSNGVRLEGNAAHPAHVQSPELDVTAQVIAFDLAGNSISEVRAQTGVNLKLNFSSQGGGAPAHIEATCNSAVLVPGNRKLVLTGNLKGFYQVQGGAKNTLSGDSATLTYTGGNLLADLVGGVTLGIPAESTGRPDAVGDIVITAQRARINQSDGSATFTGNAHAISKGGANAFDVAAPQFILTRGSDGTISTLRTSGRTLVKLDLPPDPAPAAAAPVAAPTATTPTPAKTAPTVSALGKPTHVEVAADGAIIERATSTATFDGNVKGFYRLSPPTGTPQNYNFVGNRAVIRYVVPTGAQATGNALAGLNVEVTGVPVSVEGPAFNLGL